MIDEPMINNPNWSLIPEHMRGGIERYVEHGIAPGHFLTAVICNDLKEAVGRADDENVRILHNYVKFFYNYCPRSREGMDMGRHRKPTPERAVGISCATRHVRGRQLPGLRPGSWNASGLAVLVPQRATAPRHAAIAGAIAQTAAMASPT